MIILHKTYALWLKWIFRFSLVPVFFLALIIGPAYGSGQEKERLLTADNGGTAFRNYPVKIENCGNLLFFEKPPERAVTLFAPTTEIMLALGLKDHVAGAAWTRGQAILPELEKDYGEIFSLSETSSPSREELLSVNPDFVFDNQPDYFYSAANGFATREELEAIGARVYSLTANCGPDHALDDVETIFRDVRNIGLIFDVAERAEKLVEKMKSHIELAVEKTKNVKPASVMVYIDGNGPLNVFGGRSSRYAVFRKLGIKNVFPDLDYGPVSMEEVAVRNPDFFVVSGSSYGGSAQERVRFLKETFPHAPAVKNHRVVVFPYSYMNPGIQNAVGVEKLARLLYPGVFGPGSSK